MRKMNVAKSKGNISQRFNLRVLGPTIKDEGQRFMANNVGAFGVGRKF